MTKPLRPAGKAARLARLIREGAGLVNVMRGPSGIGSARLVDRRAGIVIAVGLWNFGVGARDGSRRMAPQVSPPGATSL